MNTTKTMPEIGANEQGVACPDNAPPTLSHKPFMSLNIHTLNIGKGHRRRITLPNFHDSGLSAIAARRKSAQYQRNRLFSLYISLLQKK